MLVPQTKNSTKPLEKIDECSQNISETDICHPNTNDAITGNNNNETLKNLNEIVENESSSMSLPTSPVLSIVENISVNKSLLSSIDEHSLNVAGNEKITLNELMSPDAVDVSMPLMERNYTVEKKGEDGSQYHYTINPKNPLVTDSFLNKVCTVKIHDITLSDSLSTKLRNLLIESAKKLGKQTQSVNENDVVKTVENDADPIDKSKRGKTKKRSSTPRKKKTISKTKAPNCEPFVEEEHTEMCAQAGRKSCPPLINIFQDVDMKQVESVEDTPITANANIKKDRKKKDVIKVKISRPKRKTDIGCEESPNNNANIPNKNTINDAESGIFLGINDSVDLIHNHSETCLQTHDCIIDNSVEIVQNSKSILSIDSSSIQSERENCVSKIDGEIALELLGSNAQDGTHLFKGKILF
ncbi:uncharacterized protein LOC119831900 [Zerene cesonia]|uniref:uncharacterized protein LOC119831900 n=1 Tax=Zerene cesonia TaxID=33412 RepID=UPI0018E4E964|nr:uncharacterized protein LOC119831900 [Zerene cesonia]